MTARAAAVVRSVSQAACWAIVAGHAAEDWHMLVGTDPDAHALAHEARRRPASFSGLHLTPLEWLHMTVLIAGPTDQVSKEQAREMADAAEQMLAEVQRITVSVEKILYHPEAIMLFARPIDALMPVLEAAKEATRLVTGSPRAFQ